MYYKGSTTYYRNGSQRTRQAPFLIFFHRNGCEGLRCVSRAVALEQLGHFMMGYAKLYGKVITVSGAYGSDGLPVDLTRLEQKHGREWADKVWNAALPLPQDLYDAWNNGGGWNGVGSEAKAVAAWAKKNHSALAA